MKAQGIHLENMKRVRSFPEGEGFFMHRPVQRKYATKVAHKETYGN